MVKKWYTATPEQSLNADAVPIEWASVYSLPINPFRIVSSGIRRRSRYICHAARVGV